MSTQAGTAPVAPVGNEPKGSPSTLRRIDTTKLLGASITFVAFLVVFLIYTIWLGSKFTNTDARALDIHQNAPVLLLGLAVLVTLIAGQFDLSVGSMATLTCFLAVGLKVNQGWPLFFSMKAAASRPSSGTASMR